MIRSGQAKDRVKHAVQNMIRSGQAKDRGRLVGVIVIMLLIGISARFKLNVR